MGNCSTCDCNFGENKYEYDDNKVEKANKDEPKTQIQKRKTPIQAQSSMRNSGDKHVRFGNDDKKASIIKNAQYKNTQEKDFNNTMMTMDVKKIIKLQSVFRGHRARFMTDILKKTQRVKKKYFLDEEFWDTVSQIKRYNPKAAIVRKEYLFKCSGAKYLGEWLGGFRHGLGVMQWEDGARYEGEWVLGRANGQGQFNHTQGEVYQGQWVADKAHGIGMYIHSNGAKYEGQWKSDLQHGRGVENWPDGSVFTGEYAEGKKNGKGKYIWMDGASFEGEWEDNEIAGYGFYQWCDGRKYVGHWKSNIMDEFGVYTWQDGRRYEGFYLDDKKHGYGFYTWSDMKRYSGWWSNGKQHGIGIFISKDGKQKLGLWEDGKKVRWFSPEEAQLIEQGDGDALVRDSLQGGEESWLKIKAFSLTFQPAKEFFEARNKVENKILELEIEGADINEGLIYSEAQSLQSISMNQGNLV